MPKVNKFLSLEDLNHYIGIRIIFKQLRLIIIDEAGFGCVQMKLWVLPN